MNKRQFMRDWIEKNFDKTAIKISWQENETAIIEDKNGDTLTVEMVENTLYAGGKPYCGIPSLSE